MQCPMPNLLENRTLSVASSHHLHIFSQITCTEFPLWAVSHAHIILKQLKQLQAKEVNNHRQIEFTVDSNVQLKAPLKEIST